MGLPWAAFSVDDEAAMDEHFGDPNIKVVCACAGPFIKTYRPMVEACIRHGKHYIDINGENAVLESIRNEYGPQAKPMADVSTAYHSLKGPDGLGVPCIETYVSIPTKSTVAKCFQKEYTDGVKERDASTKVQPIGPTDEENEEGIAYVAGALFSSNLKSARAAIEFVLAGDAPAGFQSPTSAY